MVSNFFPTPYQEFIYKSRYSRYLDDENRRENWDETVSRYLNFFQKHLKDNYEFKLPETVYKKLESAILHLKVMPSMRALMTAGPALERDPIAGFNCFEGNTLVLTKEYGMRPLNELAGKEGHVWTSNNKWEPASFKKFGKQKLVKLTVGYNCHNIEIFTTANHRWKVDDKIKTTQQLNRGDKFPIAMPNRDHIDTNSIDYRLGVIHGLVYGDGVASREKKSPQDKKIASQERIRGYVIRLCSDAKELLSYFDGYQISYPPSANGDPFVYLYDNFSKTHFLKSLPPVDETEEYLTGFFRGWLAADGTVTGKTGQVSICVGPDEEDWLRTNMPKLGYFFGSSYKLSDKTNFGIRKKESRNLFIFRPSLTPEDILIDRKRQKFATFEFEFVQVRSIEFTDQEEDVYCAIVPEVEEFVLDKGIVTKNCCYITFDSPKAFDELMYILMCGTGVGFSVESKYTSQLPTVADEFHNTETTIVVDDSKTGWCKSYRELISLLYVGQIPKWDMSRVRPAGAKLKIFGGRASGPAPLDELFRFTVSLFTKASGRRLTTLEVHDLACMIANIVVVGGVRRSALISLSDLHDDRLRDAKNGQWWIATGHRRLANNSAVYEETPEIGVFMREWLSLYDSKSGERGIFNRDAVRNIVDRGNKFRESLKNDYVTRNNNSVWGCNPCSEIILRPNSFCNLTEVVVRSDDTLETLLEKVEVATILGTFQSTLTKFKYISKKFQKNAEEERLLGVSLTGVYDHPILSVPTDKSKQWLTEMKKKSLEINKVWAKKLGVEESVAITCVKPSGTVSALVNTASGLHPRHSKFLIRHVRNDIKDPVTQFMKDQGVQWEPDVMDPNNTVVFKFPISCEDATFVKSDVDAISHLKLWLFYQKHWCEHKPSVTISVKEDEWMKVGSWVYENFDMMSGVSFLPDDGNHVYKQAPFTACSEEEYRELLAMTPKHLDWSKLPLYEKEDATVATQELACTAGGCEIL